MHAASHFATMAFACNSHVLWCKEGTDPPMRLTGFQSRIEKHSYPAEP